MTQPTLSPTVQILNAALPHVPFDGWSDATLASALRDCGQPAAMGAGLFPRGGVDLALAYHRAGDGAMQDALAVRDLTQLRYRDRVALAIRQRLQVCDKEAVRRAAALFALPRYAPEGAGLIWGTADAIWAALGDTSRDGNWYTKRASLSAVYGAVVLYWLGDTSTDDADTAAFIDRRIDNIMQIETIKARARQNRIVSTVFAGPLKVFERISAPKEGQAMPGRMGR